MLPIILIALLLRLISLNQSFWLDEAAQATISRHSLTAINWAADFQPPLFYVMTLFWQGIGLNAEWFLRLPSVIFSILTIYFLFRLVDQLALKNKNASHMAREAMRTEFKKQNLYELAAYANRLIQDARFSSTLLLATSPFHLYFSQEYRMYSFFTFLTTLSWYFLYNKKLANYAIVLALALYTHYFAVLIIIAQALWMLLYRPKIVQRYLIVLAIAISPFLLWLPILGQQINTARDLITIWPKWSAVAGVGFWKFPGLLLAKFTVGMTSPEPKIIYALAVMIVGAIFLYSLVQIVLSIKYKVLRVSSFIKISHHTKYFILHTDKKIMIFGFWFFIPTILAWFSSLWISANSPHRLLFVLPAFYGIIGMGLDNSIMLNLIQHLKKIPKQVRDDKKNLSKNISLILFILLLSSNIYFSGLYLFNHKFHREDWRSATRYTDQKIGEKGIALSESNNLWAPMDWYSARPNRYIGASTEMNISEESVRQKLSPFLVSCNVLHTTCIVVLYSYLSDLSDPSHLVEQNLLKNNYKLIEERDFRGVGIIKVFDK